MILKIKTFDGSPCRFKRECGSRLHAYTLDLCVRLVFIGREYCEPASKHHFGNTKWSAIGQHTQCG